MSFTLQSLPEIYRPAFKELNGKLILAPTSKSKPEIETARNFIKRDTQWYLEIEKINNEKFNKKPLPDKVLFRKQAFIIANGIKQDDLKCKNNCGNYTIISRDNTINSYCSSACASTSDTIKNKISDTMKNKKMISSKAKYLKIIIDHIKSITCTEIIQDYKINHFTLDIYLPEYNLAISFIELIPQSFNTYDSISKAKGLNYYKYKHLNKTEACEAKGINCITIFENEFIDPNTSEIWKSILAYKLKKIEKKYYARKLIIREIPKNERELVKNFFNKNHLQGGNAIGSILIGLFTPVDKDGNSELISCMTFGKPRYTKVYDYELIRFATKLSSSCAGCAQKLLKYFMQRNSGESKLISYANRRWASANSNLYKTLGFTEKAASEPNYFYFKSGDLKLHSRVTFQKFKLKDKSETKDFFRDDLTELEIANLAGYRRIYDSGNMVYSLE